MLYGSPKFWGGRDIISVPGWHWVLGDPGFRSWQGICPMPRKSSIDFPFLPFLSFALYCLHGWWHLLTTLALINSFLPGTCLTWSGILSLSVKTAPSHLGWGLPNHAGRDPQTELPGNSIECVCVCVYTYMSVCVYIIYTHTHSQISYLY